jgi:hypothetical protein
MTWRSTFPVLFLALLAGASTGCWRIGEPTESDVLVTWAAYPDTVLAGKVFSFEFAGPVTPNACGRLDTATVEISASAINLAGRRSVYETMCAQSPVSFYEARPLVLDSAGSYVVRAAGSELGTIVAIDSGSFSRMTTIGRGTVRDVESCLLFGPGRLGNQRPFALLGRVPDAVANAAELEIVHVSGALAGFTLCGLYGSRPAIRVDTAWVTGQLVDDYYRTGDN